MNIFLQLDIARSLVLARWKQSLVAAVGVTFGIGMFIALLGFMTGLNNMLDALILNRTPHIRLFKEIKPQEVQPIERLEKYKGYTHFISSIKTSAARTSIYNGLVILKTLRKDHRVLGCTERIPTPVFFTNGNVDIQGNINGINIAEERRLFAFDDYVIDAVSSDVVLTGNSIVLGKGLAKRLRVHTGDIINISTISGDHYDLKVTGLFQSGVNEFDNIQSYATVSTVQKLLGKPNNYITDIAVKLKDINMAPELAREYASVFKTDAEDIQTANAEFDTGNRVRLTISYAVGITMLIVAGFGIYNILNMLIYEKMDAIAILKATGFSGGDVKSIFTSIALGTGLVGGIAGLMLGSILLFIISYIPFRTTAFPTIRTYPVIYSLHLFVIAIIFSTITTYLAGWFPSRKASKIDPVIIIRGR